MQTYHFYGWEQADCLPVNKSYFGIHSPRDLYDELCHIWSADTCAPRLRDRWSMANKTTGQCTITAFLAQDIFGGKVYGIPLGDGNFYCYNVVGGHVFDLTSEQFEGKGLDYEAGVEQSREEHFKKAEKRHRYALLKDRLAKRCDMAGGIIGV